MNFWAVAHSSDHARRLRLHYNARGIAHYLTTGQHPLALAFRFRVHAAVSLYVEGPRKANSEVTSGLLTLAGQHFPKPLSEFDALSLSLRVANVDEEDVSTLVTWVFRQLHHGNKEFIKMKVSETVPPDVMSRLESSLASLEQALIDKDPMMPQHLRNTHSLLISYPETVHLLEDVEIAKLIDAAEIHTKTEIVKAAVRGKGGSGSRKKIDVGDL